MKAAKSPTMATRLAARRLLNLSKVPPCLAALLDEGISG
jgi:hypothetical protein